MKTIVPGYNQSSSDWAVKTRWNSKQERDLPLLYELGKFCIERNHGLAGRKLHRSIILLAEKTSRRIYESEKRAVRLCLSRRHSILMIHKHTI